MSETKILHMDDLLAPLEGDSPCGEDLRYEGLYDSIRDLRKEDDPEAPQGIWETDLRQADWAAVRKLAEGALTNQTKDVQIAAWLTEALARQHGLNGLAEGFEFITRLCNLFWPDLYPALEDEDDEEGLEARIAPIEWILGQATIMLSTMPLTRADGEGIRYTWQTWVAAQRLQALASSDKKQYEKAVKSGEVNVDRFRAVASQTPTEFFEEWRDGLETLSNAVKSLKNELDDKAGNVSPSFRALADQITEMRAMIKRQLVDRGVTGATAAEEEEEEDNPLAGLIGAGGGSAGGPLLARPIATRQEAYALLDAVSRYIQATEPHSPTAYLVRRAVSWGNMSLSELLSELSEDTSNMNDLVKLLRLRDG